MTAINGQGLKILEDEGLLEDTDTTKYKTTEWDRLREMSARNRVEYGPTCYSAMDEFDNIINICELLSGKGVYSFIFTNYLIPYLTASLNNIYTIDIMMLESMKTFLSFKDMTLDEIYEKGDAARIEYKKLVYGDD